MSSAITLYETAKILYEENKVVICVDQKTGIQALERLFPDKLVRNGCIKKREFEYKRHGTQNLIAGFVVATGHVFGKCYDRNRNDEFCDFLTYAYSIHEKFNEIHIIADNYGTHTHINTCLCVAKLCGIYVAVEELKTKNERIKFLESKDKKIIFHFLPTHASWLNQIEIWFSILQKKVIRCGNFSGVVDLVKKIVNYMDLDWNKDSQPFKWTYKGKVCFA